MAVGYVALNTLLAAAAGTCVAAATIWIVAGKPDIGMAGNGTLAGLVAITAEPLAPSPLLATFIGAAGGVIVFFSVLLLDKLKFLVGGLLGNGLDGRVAACRHHQRGGQRAQLHPDAGREIMPARFIRQVERQHSQYTSMSLIRVAVHIRPTTLSREACQSKVACTPCGPEISIRGRGR